MGADSDLHWMGRSPMRPVHPDVMGLPQISPRILCAADNFCGVGDQEEIIFSPKIVITSNRFIDSIDINRYQQISIDINRYGY